MEQYIGTKVINAKPMSRQEYNNFRGWKLPDDENGNDTGFLVEYLDGGQANTTEYSGYVSWSPTEVFINAYKCNGELSFGDAIVYLKVGRKLTRSSWNGKGMFIFLVEGSSFTVNRAPLLGIYEEGTRVVYQPHIDMKTANDTIVPWFCSQSDMLANDWEVL